MYVLTYSYWKVNCNLDGKYEYEECITKQIEDTDLNRLNTTFFDIRMNHDCVGYTPIHFDSIREYKR